MVQPGPPPPPPPPPPLTDATIRDAVEAAVAAGGPEYAHPVHGPIAGWDVSAVTDMNRMFYHASAFPAGSTKKRKRCARDQAKKDATAAKRAAIAAEVALGPLPAKRHRGEGPFAPQLLRVGLFDSDLPGERWAAHPDYTPSQLLVSNRGNVRKRGLSGVGEYEHFTIGSLRKNGYREVGIGGKKVLVHILVCEAFHGPKPSEAHTVDHFHDRDHSSNCAWNLRWATPAEQRANQEMHRVQSTGVPVLARKVGSPADADWVEYASATDAGKALGIDPSSISDVCNQKKGSITAGGYEFRYAPPREDQGDLPAEWVETPDGRLWVPTETWECDPESGGRTRVSTRGRVQTRMHNGGWTPRRTPRAGAGMVYATVSGSLVHRVVWRTFRPDDPPIDDETIDHRDQDTSDSALHNLRRATPSMQARNQDRPSADDIARPRTPVLAWKDGASRATAKRFIGQHAAARALNARFETTKFTQSGIRSAVLQKCNHNYWRFALVPETAEEVAAREAQRARVLAAIAALRAEAADGEMGLAQRHGHAQHVLSSRGKRAPATEGARCARGSP